MQQTLDLFVRMLGGLPFLAAMVRTSKRAAYKTRRWAPLRPSASAILCAAKAPGLTHGAVLRSIIVARIFAVTSSRLGTWDTPCSKSDYNDRTKKTYRPFGHKRSTTPKSAGPKNRVHSRESIYENSFQRQTIDWL